MPAIFACFQQLFRTAIWSMLNPPRPNRYTAGVITSHGMARFLLTLLGLLAGGVVCTMVVAWACARWGDHRPARYVVPPTEIASVPDVAAWYLNDPAYLRRDFYGTPSPIVTPTPQAGFSLDPAPSRGSERESGLDMEQRGSAVSTRTTYSRWLESRFMGESRSYTLVQFGYPFRCMQYDERGNFGRTSIEEAGAIRLPGWRGGWPISLTPQEQRSWNYRAPARVYPLLPMLGGFAANTGIYAAGLGIVLVMVRVIRRAVRHREGLCSSCGYPIGVSPVCTECGTAIARG